MPSSPLVTEEREPPLKTGWFGRVRGSAHRQWSHGKKGNSRSMPTLMHGVDFDREYFSRRIKIGVKRWSERLQGTVEEWKGWPSSPCPIHGRSQETAATDVEALQRKQQREKAVETDIVASVSSSINILSAGGQTACCCLLVWAS